MPNLKVKIKMNYEIFDFINYIFPTLLTIELAEPPVVKSLLAGLVMYLSDGD